tara:strand:+ start:312 stop:1331 length:1020 start_codon:yes stop_codon:yes gene_type:complete
MSHRWACDCCEHGSCVDAVGDCPSSVAYSFTTPEALLERRFNTSPVPDTTVTESTLYLNETTSEGVVTCTNEYAGSDACQIEYMCANCYKFAGCSSCDDKNVCVTTIPCVLKKCSGTDCGTAPYQQNVVRDLGTASGLDMCSGITTVTRDPCGGGGAGWEDPCSISYTPFLQTMLVVPEVVSLDIVSGGGAYWEYQIHFYFATTWAVMGAASGDGSNCGDLVDNCGRTCGIQQVLDIGMFSRTGIFTVRKLPQSCFRAEWNGATQTASGTNVISITPPTSSGAAPLSQWYLPRRCTAATGDQSCTWTECTVYSSANSYAIKSTDTMVTSFGGTCSWSIT